MPIHIAWGNCRKILFYTNSNRESTDTHRNWNVKERPSSMSFCSQGLSATALHITQGHEVNQGCKCGKVSHKKEGGLLIFKE